MTGRPYTDSYNMAEKDIRYNKNTRGLERMKVPTILKCATVDPGFNLNRQEGHERLEWGLISC